MLRKVKGLFQLLRFELPFAAGICVIIGQILALGRFANLFIILFGSLSVFLISASLLVMNDYFDVETDRINAPERPIPSNLVSKNEALIFALSLIVVGLLFSGLINIFSFIFVLILFVIGFLYNWRFKQSGLIGNLLVSFSVGMTFIYGGLTVGNPFHHLVIFFSIIAGLIDLGEEIAADAMDIDGDKLINSKSVAIKYGRNVAIKISSIIFFIIVILTSIPFIFGWLSLVFIIPFLIIDLSIIIPTIKLLKSKNQEGRKYIKWIYMGATLGLIVFLVVYIFW